MDEILELESVQEALIQAIDQDPDPQVKNIIATQLAQRNSLLLTKRLVSLSLSLKPAVREVIALALEGHFEVLEDLLNWFKRETDDGILYKLYMTIASSLKHVPEDYDFSSVLITLKFLIQEERNINFSLELIGYCPVPETLEILFETLHKFRFIDRIRESILRGFYHFTQKTGFLPKKIQETIISMVTAPFEPEIVRKTGLDALGEVNNQQVFDLLELIIETDYSPVLRKHAIEIASKWDVMDLSVVIIEKLRLDGVSDVRKAAAVALGKMSCFEALPDLAESLENDSSFFVREAAAEALGVLKSQQAIMSLLKGLEDQDSYVREISAWSIEQLEPSLDMIISICRAANSLETEPQVKKGMVSLLGRLSFMPVAAAAANCLLQILENDRTPLREQIFEALENYVTLLNNDKDFLENYLPYILNILSTSPSFGLRAAICTFLGHLQDSTTFPFLLNRLLNDSDHFVQRQAAWAISNLSPTEHSSEIHEITNEKKHQAVLPLILDILSSWPRLSDLPLTLNYINSNNIEIRQRAVEWITAIIASSDLDLTELAGSIIELLIDLLMNDKANTVRAASAHALGHFHNHEYDSTINLALITAIKEDRIYSVRELAAEALGFRGGMSIIEDLKQLINHKIEKDPSIRYFASIALLNAEDQIAKRLAS